MAKQDSRIKDLEDIQAVFDKFGVRMFLVYGALLGFHRDGDFLPGDDDIDLAVVDPIDFKTRKQIGRTLLALGFNPQPISFNVCGELEPSVPGYNGDDKSGIIVCERNFKFTIFFFEKEVCNIHGPEYVCKPMYGSVKLISTPAKFFVGSYKIKIGKKQYLTPWPIKDYLAFTYFNNWEDKTDRRHGELHDVMHKDNVNWE